MNAPGPSISGRGSVTLNLRDFKREFRAGRQPLRLLTPDDPAFALAAFRATVADHRSRWESSSEPLPWVSDPIQTPRGPICRFSPDEASDPFEPILKDIAAGLAARGVTGTLRPATPDRYPVLADHPPQSRYVVLSVLLQLPIDLDRLYTNVDVYGLPRYDWLVDHDRTRQIWQQIAEWCVESGGGTYLYSAVQTTQVEPNVDDIVDLLISAPPTPWGSHYLFGIVNAGPDRLRFVGSDMYGQVTLQQVDAASDQLTALEDLTTAADQLSPLAWTTSIREATSVNWGWSGPTFNHRPPIDAIGGPGIDWWQILHLLPDHVLDAYVHQVLTDSQLAKTNLHPDRWQILPLGNGRHAVTAKDPTPWLDRSKVGQPVTRDNRPTGIDQATLDQARLDFGDAIITHRTLEQHPPPLAIPTLPEM